MGYVTVLPKAASASPWYPHGVRVLVGVTGGIAAYKSALLVRELMRRGHEVRVVMTQAATRFVGPITFTGLTGEAPVVDLWDPRYSGEVHVDLASWADVMVIAPATANAIARIVHGLADDALTAARLCFEGPLVVAPAMHARMWASRATQRNVEQLRSDGAVIVGPVAGALANNEVGLGRMAEPDAIADAVSLASDLGGVTLLVSAGGTEEDVDPVRFLGNRSTGRMGFALAARGAARGATVILVSGPCTLETPAGVERVDVRSAREMEAAITARRDGVDAIIMAAAVADYRPAEPALHKLKKGGPLRLELVENPDILGGLGQWRDGPRPLLVGFALETENVVANARGKLERKNVDLVVANHAGDALGTDTNRVTIVSAEGQEEIPLLDKRAVADRILDRIVALRAG